MIVLGLAALAVLFSPLCAPTAQAGPILSDNFNSENGGLAQLNYTNFANFNVTAGSVDLIGNGSFDFYPGNGLYVDLDGSTGQAGTLTTKQTFAPGTYTFSFDLAGSARGVDSDVVVNFGSFSHDFFLPSSQGYTLFTETVTLTAPAQLSFRNVQPGDIGAILDNVTVTATPAAPVLEPSSLALLSLGGLALAARRRWKSNRPGATA